MGSPTLAESDQSGCGSNAIPIRSNAIPMRERAGQSMLFSVTHIPAPFGMWGGGNTLSPRCPFLLQPAHVHRPAEVFHPVYDVCRRILAQVSVPSPCDSSRLGFRGCLAGVWLRAGLGWEEAGAGAACPDPFPECPEGAGREGCALCPCPAAWLCQPWFLQGPQTSPRVPTAPSQGWELLRAWLSPSLPQAELQLSINSQLLEAEFFIFQKIAEIIG